MDFVRQVSHHFVRFYKYFVAFFSPRVHVCTVGWHETQKLPYAYLHFTVDLTYLPTNYCCGMDFEAALWATTGLSCRCVNVVRFSKTAFINLCGVCFVKVPSMTKHVVWWQNATWMDPVVMLLADCSPFANEVTWLFVVAFAFWVFVSVVLLCVDCGTVMNEGISMLLLISSVVFEQIAGQRHKLDRIIIVFANKFRGTWTGIQIFWVTEMSTRRGALFTCTEGFWTCILRWCAFGARICFLGPQKISLPIALSFFRWLPNF